MNKTIVSLALLSALVMMPVQAEFVSTDWQNSGDALATLDTDTGIEWLDLTQTFNLSYAQMNDRLATDLDGWRYATFTEVVDLVGRFFNSDPLSWSGQYMPGADDTSEERQLWRSLFGVNNTAGSGISMGVVRFDAANTTSWSLFGPYHYGSDMTYVVPPSGGYAYGAQNGYSGYFIVSDGGDTLSSINNPSLNANNPNAPASAADVSVPAGLGVLALAGLLGLRRKRKV